MGIRAPVDGLVAAGPASREEATSQVSRPGCRELFSKPAGTEATVVQNSKHQGTLAYCREEA